jgi:AraC-like DNA-binding protein
MGAVNRLSHINQPRTLVENRVSFAGPHAELSIYDTYQAAEKVELRSGELMYCGMIQGRKVIRGYQSDDLEESYEVEFLPHESFVLAPYTTIEIDFPEAKLTKPTRCLTVEIEAERISRIAKTLHKDNGLPMDRFDCHGDQSSVFHTCHTEGTQLLLERLFRSFTENDIDRDLAIDFGVSELVTRMLRHQGREFLLSNARQNPEQNGIQASLALIEKQLAQPLDIDQLCKSACMSRSRFYCEFKKQLGCSPAELQQQLRLRQAAERLAAGESATRICFDLGYSNLSHFSRRFQKQFGKPPSHYSAGE